MTVPLIDVTGVFDKDYNQVFPLARSMRAAVDRASKPMAHPLEDGSEIIDHRVFLATTIELLLFLPESEYKNIYGQIDAAYKAGQMFTVQTKAASFPNMFISEMPHQETPDFADLVQVALKLHEARFVKTQFEAIEPRKEASKKTVKSGEKTAKKETEDPTKKKASVAYKIFNK